MTHALQVSITTPVGRIVQGSVSTAQTTDMEGKALVDKKTGAPKSRYYFGLAIPKTPGKHWGAEGWGQPIWNAGHGGFPQGQATRPDFAWKITDGDSDIPNKQGRKPKEQAGFAGHWILRLSSEYPPKCYNSTGTSPMDPVAIKTGYYVQVALTCAPNDDANRNPGVYLNPSLVSFQAYGEEIMFGPDPTAVGFGQNVALPAGASTTPIGNMTATGTPPPPAAPPAPAPATQAAPPPPAAPAPVAVQPHPTIVPAPSTTPPPPPPAAPAAPAARQLQMTPKAQGATPEQYRAAGWTDDQMVAQGVAVWA